MRPLLILLALAALAQEQQTPVFRSDVTMVHVDAQVTDRGRLVAGLAKEDFEVFDEGKQQDVVYFGRESEPLDVILLLDVSGSMRRYVEQMAATAREALGQLRGGDRVAVMLFSRRSKISEEFTPDFAEVAREMTAAVREQGLGAGTAINEALLAAAAYAGRQPARPGRRAVLILTDNSGLNYQTPDEQAIRALYDADCVLNAIVAKGGERPKPPKPGEYVNPDFTPSDVFRIAEETGGEAVKVERAGTAFREMIERLRTRYSLHYRAPEAEAGTFRRIRVALSEQARKRLPKAEVRARAGYYASR